MSRRKSVTGPRPATTRACAAISPSASSPRLVSPPTMARAHIFAALACFVVAFPRTGAAQARDPLTSLSPFATSPPPPPFVGSKPPLSPTDLAHKRVGDYVTGFPLFAEDPNTGYGAGAAAFYYDDGPASDALFAYTPYKLRVYALAFVTTKGQFFSTLDLDVPYVAGTGFRLRSYATFERNISTNYYGQGERTLDELRYSGAPGRTFSWAPRYDDDINARRADGTTYARYNNYVLARPAAHVSIERDLFGGIVRPILGFTVSHTYVRDYTGLGVDAIANGSLVTSTQASTLLHEDCTAGRVIGCDGGWDNLVKIGIAYDTRDFEPDPNSGIFADLTTEFALRGLGSSLDYGRVTAGMRGYVSLLPHPYDVVLAARYVYSVSFGDVPFYAMPTLSFTQHFEDGLGGVQSLRGFRGQRFVGRVMTFGNAELRWTFARFDVWKEHIALTTGPFVDMGRVFDRVSFAFDKWKRTQGAMLRASWNEATVVGIEAGANEEDYAIYVDYGHQF